MFHKNRKNVWALFLALLISFSLFMTQAPAVVLAAEADTDLFSISGAVKILRYCAKVTELTEAEKEIYDFNLDGRVTIVDAVIIMHIVADMPVHLSGDAYQFLISDNQVTILKYLGSKDTVVIPSAIKGKSVTKIEANAFAGCKSVTSVTVPASVTDIGLQTSPSLASIQVSGDNPNYSSQDGVLFNKGKTKLLFCPQGKKGDYTIPDSVTKIDDCAFVACASLTSVTIPDSVTEIGLYVFPVCLKLTSVTIPASVTSIGRLAFWNCQGLTSVYFKGNAPALGEQAFSETAPGFKIYYKEGAEGWSNPWNGYPVTALAATATDILFPYIVNVSDDQVAITKYIGLEKAVVIPSQIKGKSVTRIEKYAFSGCDSVTSVTVPDSVTDMDGLSFANARNLLSIQISSGHPNFSVQDGVLFNKDKTILIFYPSAKAGDYYTIPNGVTKIADASIVSCPFLTSVTIPDSVTDIGMLTFFGCPQLTSLIIPGSVTNMGKFAFSACQSLTSVYFEGNAPAANAGVFWFAVPGFKIYYKEGAEGWSDPWYGHPTAPYTDS